MWEPLAQHWKLGVSSLSSCDRANGVPSPTGCTWIRVVKKPGQWFVFIQRIVRLEGLERIQLIELIEFIKLID